MKDDPYGTENLFDPEPFIGAAKEKPKSIKSVAQANCPKCSKNKVGVLASNGHYMWRLHTYRTHGGTVLPCPASGVYLCSCPEGLPPYSSDGNAVKCPHGRNV